MRELARELGVVPMSIYHHIPSKQALLELVVDLVMSEVPTPTPSRRAWAEQMRAYTMASWEALAACPGLGAFALQLAPRRSTFRLAMHGVAILRAAGFDERTAALSSLTYHAHVFGLLTVHARYIDDARSAKSDKQSDREQSAGVIAGPLDDLAAREWIEFGIETALAGLCHQLANVKKRRGKPAPAPSRRAIPPR